MTAYASRAQLAQHGLPSGALTNVPTATQDAALEAGARRIDTYLRAQCSVPLLSPGEDIVEANCVLAGFSILTTKGHNPTFFDTVFQKRYDDTIQWLRDIAAGRVTLDPGIDATPEIDEGAPKRTSRGPVVSYSSTVETNEPRGW